MKYQLEWMVSSVEKSECWNHLRDWGFIFKVLTRVKVLQRLAMLGGYLRAIVPVPESGRNPASTSLMWELGTVSSTVIPPSLQ